MPKQITVSFMMFVCLIILMDTISLFYNIPLTEILHETTVQWFIV